MDSLHEIKALVFDVFGTVVDWRASIIREGKKLSRETGLVVDWAELADAWRGGYAPAMNRVNSGELPWTTVDGLHRMILDSLLPQFGLESLDENRRADLNRAWHRLRPWPDARNGLRLIRSRFIVATLSNGNVALLTNMARHARLPWDCILSAELVRRYKPDPAVYRMACELLDLPPPQVMMVAAHSNDLRAAQAVGLRTAFVARPHEFGPGNAAQAEPDGNFDITAADFLDLADQLNAATASR